VSENCRFSIIIPVLHESRIINTLLDSLKSLKSDDPFEIIIVDGSPTQDTIQVISRNNVMKYSSPQGRGRQMNEGAIHATGDILVFLHADTFLPPDALSLIRTTLEDQRFVGGAFSLGIRSKNPILTLIALGSTLRSRFTRTPYGDQVIFLRTSFFKNLGGFRDIPLMEDVELMRRVRKKGGRIFILSTRVMTSDRRWRQEGFLYTTVRDLLIIFLYWCGMSAEKLAKYYPWQNE
jgi:rSAM/selenodomain-associated transferase 2